MKDYKLYLFDFDGCLVDTYYALEYVFKESFKPFNIDVTFEEVIKFCRQPLPVSFKEKGGKDEEFKEFNRLIDLYLKDRQTVTNSVLFPETIKFLNCLKSKGKKIGIVTSNNIPHVKEVLEYFNIDTDLFDVYVGNQESKIHKPNPDPILKALELLDYKYS